MYYAQIRKYDIANGPGIRSSLFVSGCTHQCKSCFNEEYQNFYYGRKWTPEVCAGFVKTLADEKIKGVTIIGGEPMDQINDNDLLNLVKQINTDVKKSIWIYSGYTYEQIINHEKRKQILTFCDVLVDGLFVQAQKDLRLKFKGSRNQRIIDIRKSLSANKVELLAGYEECASQ